MKEPLSGFAFDLTCDEAHDDPIRVSLATTQRFSSLTWPPNYRVYLTFTVFTYGFNTGAPASVASHLSVIAANVPSAVIASTAPETHVVIMLSFASKRPN